MKSPPSAPWRAWRTRCPCRRASYSAAALSLDREKFELLRVDHDRQRNSRKAVRAIGPRAGRAAEAPVRPALAGGDRKAGGSEPARQDAQDHRAPQDLY